MVYFCGLIPAANRLSKSDYLISEYISEIGKARYLHGDKSVVDLSMGNPDLIPPEKAKEALKEKVNDLWSHRYNNPKGEGALLYEVGNWMQKRFGVKINPKTEVMVTSGSSDAIDHIFTAYANYGDKVLVPNPGYSLYDDLITRHDLKPTDGTYYLWAKVPPEFTSDEFFKYVLHKSQVAFTPGTVFGTNGEGYVRIVMSADKNIINKSFEKIEKAGIRFDIPKSKLPKEVQDEIASMADGTYTITPKGERDFAQYKIKLAEKHDKLTAKFANKSPNFAKFIPKKDIELPWNIVKDGQSVYLQNIREGKALLGEVTDIMPFSDKQEYEKLSEEIKKQWLSKKYQQANILPAYKTRTLYNDANYFTLRTEDGRLQAIANIEIKNNGEVWGRNLNTAPWNQGKNAEIKGADSAIIARMISFCLETGNKTLKFATNKPENIKLYKSLGMVKDGTKNINGENYTVLKFDEASMRAYLNKYQINLTC